MSSRSLGLSDALQGYLIDSVFTEPGPLERLREETARLPGAGMQISPEQGRFMAWLVRLMGARRCLELGVFTGYSSLSVALALPEGGSLVACDTNSEWSSIARRYWAEASVQSKVELLLGPAVQSMDNLLARGEAGTFDFVFVDADKQNYPVYYERGLTLLREGGVLLFDNALWGGRVADPQDRGEDTVAIRAINQKAKSDSRVDACLVPIGDGLLLLRKRNASG